ncbi:MAG: T9SS type A sorting domain-containing protein [Bacteroidota bacterium]
MKKKFLFISAFIISVLIIYSSFTNIPPAGTTSAPGEFSCSGVTCHSGTPNTGPGYAEIVIMGDETATTYIPGVTIMLMPYVIDNTKQVSGFQTVARLANGNSAGSVTLFFPDYTELITSGGYEYVCQTGTGAIEPITANMHDWMYNWEAPAAGSGTVIIYGAFVTGPGFGSTANNNVYSDSLVLNEDTSSGIYSLPYASQDIIIERIYPVPLIDFVNIDIRTVKPSGLSVTLIDMNGKVIITESTFPVNSTKFCYKLNMSALTDGIYFVKVKQGDNAEVIQRIVKI